MFVLMRFPLMAGMVMVMGTMFAFMIMIVNMGCSAMAVFMQMLVHMFMGMLVGVLVAVGLSVVGMLVGVGVVMVMTV
jgi:hypothetical protein